MKKNLTKTVTLFAVLSLFALVFTFPLALKAQESDAELQSLKRKASELIEQQKFTEATPILEKILLMDEQDAESQFYYGFALLGQANNTKDKAARKQIRARARTAFVKAKELGKQEPIVDAFISSLPPDGSEASFSQNEQADQAMRDAEAVFSQGKMDEALALYQKALKLDPKIYEAALFSGDAYLKKNDFANAEIWYQKAIAIDPNRETAYRYSATPLMRQKKYDQARDRYIEAFISEPYSRFANIGLSQWAQITQTSIGHPKIEMPTDVTFNEKGDAQINLDINSLLRSGKDDGSTSWVVYGATRSVWRKEKFAKTFPAEKTYRHSLMEEAEAIRSVLTLADSKKKETKTLNPSLAALKKLNDAGLLEAYILLAIPDDGIAEDYPNYLKQNRDKLRRYVVEYVLTNGGK
jgi:tetratricopeptide (TPR) repeat protein